MKKFTYSWAVVLICTMLTFLACEENIEEDVNPINQDNDEEEIPDDPAGDQLKINEVLECIDFTGSSLVPGDIPSSSNSLQFQIDTDTIFWVDGIKKRIRIRYPAAFTGIVSSILVQVEGADKHFEIPLDETESREDEGVFYFAYGTSSSCPVPPTFDVDIAVKEESGSIVYTFEDKPVVIEQKISSKASPVGQWDWLYTTLGGEMNRAKGYPEITPGTVKGCCDSGVSYYGNCIGTVLEGTVNYEAFYMQTYEYVEFFDDGSLEGVLHEDIRNIDPTTSDFCNDQAGYKDRVIHNIFSGAYSFNEATGKISLSNMEGIVESVTIGSNTYEVPLPLYFGNFGNVEMISSHFMVDRSTGDGGGMERVFERRSTADEWYD